MTPAISTGNTIVSDSVAKPTLSSREIVEKLSSINAEQIELIGTQIVQKVLNNLGPVRKLKVALKVSEAKGEPMNGIEQATLLLSAKQAISNGKRQFLSKLDASRFVMTALWPVKSAIRESFSTPSAFLRDGLFFQLSDYEPEGFLAETAEKMGIALNFTDVPTKYCVRLKLDNELTNEKSDLVFSIIEQSHGVIFPETYFTVKELEEKFYSQFT